MTTLSAWTDALYQIASFEVAAIAVGLLTAAILAAVFGAIFLRPKKK